MSHYQMALMDSLNITHEYDIHTKTYEPKDMITNFKIIMLIIILSIGIIGNVLNMIVFSQKKMRQETTFRFLLYLSIFDILVLIFGIKDLLIKQLYDFDPKSISNFVCKVDSFLNYSLTHIANFILTAVSLHRAIKMKNLLTYNEATPAYSARVEDDDNANKHKLESIHLNQFISFTNNRSDSNTEIETFILRNPLEIKEEKNTFFSKISVDFTIIIIIIVMLLLNLHFILFISLNDVVVLQPMDNFNLSAEETEYLINSTFATAKKCYAQTDTFYENFLKNSWVWIDMSVYSIIPFALMTVSSISIALKFKKINKKYSFLLVNKNYKLNKKNYLKKIKKNRQVCLILLNQNFYCSNYVYGYVN